jgi:hypothetical protein
MIQQRMVRVPQGLNKLRKKGLLAGKRIWSKCCKLASASRGWRVSKLAAALVDSGFIFRGSAKLVDD